MPREVGPGTAPPLYRSWDPDDSPDFHASRLLILLLICGNQPGPHIAGRTKFAKLDFFIRYPTFLERAQVALLGSEPSEPVFRATQPDEVEAPMIRYRYGPWDLRYRQFLAFLSSRGLISITTSHNPERVRLMAPGVRLAERLAGMNEFQPIVVRCRAMQRNLATMSGTDLKNLVYELFPDEVGELAYRQEIRP